MEWQRGITRAVEGFPGYRATDIYPPAETGNLEWVVVVEFDSPEALQAWLDSPARAEWTGRLPSEIANFRLKTLPTGFGHWFSGLVAGPDEAPPPGWKMALTILLGLYPTVMLLSLVVGPYISPLGLAVSMLISNALSCVLLQWVVVPPLTALLAPWLTARPERGKIFAVGGVMLIVLVLGILAVLFRQITG